MLNILVAEERSIIRKGLVSIISKEFNFCTCVEVKNYNELLNSIEKHSFDLIIVDINLSNQSGLNVVKQLKIINSFVPILLIDIKPDEELIKRCIIAGASGYLNINTEPEEIVIAVKNIINGSKYIGSHVMNKFLSLMGHSGTSSDHEKLSDREFEVLRLIGEKKTSSEIANILSLSIKTISTYKSRILIKLNLNSPQEIFSYALENDMACRN